MTRQSIQQAIRNAESSAIKAGTWALTVLDWDFYRQLLSVHAYWCGSARYWRNILKEV